jgi:signal transduction histidine kinase
MKQDRGQLLESPAPVATPRLASIEDGPRRPDEDSAVFKVTAAIAEAVTPAEVYEALVDRVADAVGASSAGLWLVGAEGKGATLVRSRGYSAEAARAMEELELDRPSVMPVLDCIRSAAPLWIPSQAALYEQYPHLRMLATAGRSYRVSCLPLVAQERVLGSLALTIEQAGEATDAEKEFLLLVARYATQALERLRLYEAERQSRAAADAAAERLRVLHRFAAAVVSAERIDPVYQAAFDSIQAVLGIRRAAILTFDDQMVMRFRAWRELSDHYRSAVDGHSPWPPDASSPEPVIVSDALHDAAWVSYAETFRSEGIGALAFFPLVARGRLLGKVMLYHDAPHTFSAVELETVRAIGYYLGSVIARFAAWADLEETVRYNELFAGVLAHDLRTPLSAIMGAAQLLVRREGGPTSIPSDGRAAARIVSSGGRMSAMIGQLLDFTQSRSGGGIKIERHQTNLDELCAQALAELELVHPEWTIRREAFGDLVGTWDSGRLVQVISNVISNAGQHGEPGQPIGVKLAGGIPDHVLIEVRNRGAIPPEILPHLFDPFRTTRERAGQSSGLGLGLFIVREIVRSHGGSVDVSSSEPAGTTICIRLPRRG